MDKQPLSSSIAHTPKRSRAHTPKRVQFNSDMTNFKELSSCEVLQRRDQMNPDYYISYEKDEVDNNWTKVAKTILHTSKQDRKDFYLKVTTG